MRTRLHGVAMVLAIAAVLTGCAPEAGPVPEADTAEAVTSAPDMAVLEKGNQTVTHDEAVTAENREALLASLRIEAGLPPEEKAKKITDNQTRWGEAGATVATVALNQRHIADASTDVNEVLARSIAESNSEAFLEGIYGPDWKDVSDWASKGIDVNEANIFRFISSFDSEDFPNYNRDNKEAYTESWSEDTELTGWADSTGASDAANAALYARATTAYGPTAQVIQLTATRTNNAAKNMFGEDPSYAENDKRQIYMSLVLVEQEGRSVIRYQLTSNDPNIEVSY